MPPLFFVYLKHRRAIGAGGIIMDIQIFVSEPTEDGYFRVSRWVFQEANYIPLKGEIFVNEFDAVMRANELNKEYLKNTNNETF